MILEQEDDMLDAVSKGDEAAFHRFSIFGINRCVYMP